MISVLRPVTATELKTAEGGEEERRGTWMEVNKGRRERKH